MSEPLPEVPRPDVARATVLVPAPEPGPGNWAGAPSIAAPAAADDDDDDGDGFWLAYRLRRPPESGRGVAVLLARYRRGRLEQAGRIERELFGAESLQRPALIRRPDGGWRLYLSCATPGSKHWWIECLDADTVPGLPSGRRSIAFPGSSRLAVKDPVLHRDGSGWHAWVCCHPLDEPGQEDRMWSGYARSDDGLSWSEPVPVLRPRPGRWDSRGTRITAVLPGRRLIAYYDGRPDAARNFCEQTGLAAAADAADSGPQVPLQPLGNGPAATSPFGTGALRYLSLLRRPDGRYRLCYEACRPDGGHDLLTQVVPAG